MRRVLKILELAASLTLFLSLTAAALYWLHAALGWKLIGPGTAAAAIPPVLLILRHVRLATRGVRDDLTAGILRLLTGRDPPGWPPNWPPCKNMAIYRNAPPRFSRTLQSTVYPLEFHEISRRQSLHFGKELTMSLLDKIDFNDPVAGVEGLLLGLIEREIDRIPAGPDLKPAMDNLATAAFTVGIELLKKYALAKIQSDPIPLLKRLALDYPALAPPLIEAANKIPILQPASPKAPATSLPSA